MAFKASLVKDGKLVIVREDAQSIGALIKAWETCQYLIQVHRRVPNPESLKPAIEKPNRHKPSSAIPLFTPVESVLEDKLSEMGPDSAG